MTIKREKAKLAMWEYYRANKALLPPWIEEYREDVLEGLIDGKNPSFVFWSIVRNVEQDTPNQSQKEDNFPLKVAA